MIALYVIAFIANPHNEILLSRRCNTGFGDGLYSLPGGKVEVGETARAGISREIHEELGLYISEADFELRHTFHRQTGKQEIIVLCFVASLPIDQEVINLEPDKCDDLKFFSLEFLPENIIPAHKQAIECIKKGVTYSEHGWKN